MKKCLQTCKELNIACPIEECRYWILYPPDANCTIEAVNKAGAMTLREVADRMQISFVRVKQIQDKALKKISLLFDKESI